MIAIVAGTRPELIKVAPLYIELKRRDAKVALWLTGQHESLAKAPVEFFGITPSCQWKTLEPGQSSNILLAKLVRHLDQEIEETRPQAIIVQGDTTSGLAGALAGFHRKIPIAHVEAGLRTGDLDQPFPEEMNRRVIDSFARWLFPPTEKSKQALHDEGHRHVEPSTGNTGVDALFWAREKIRKEKYWPQDVPRVSPNAKLVLSTGHRSENLGSKLFQNLRALGEVVSQTPGAVLFHCVHPNPEATRLAVEALKGFDQVHLLPPLDYPDFVCLLDAASVVVTDSGGIQEEAACLSLPVLITREVTERPEVLSCGGKLVGSSPALLVEELKKSLEVGRSRSEGYNLTPFGDGKASERIISRILSDLASK